jgi:HAD superfamily hydrolase (TIGR01509 family)
MIRAAIFDMDGLLFDTERLCCDAWRAVASAAGYAMEDELFFRCVGRNNRDTKGIVLDALGPEFPYDDFNRDAKAWMQARMAENGPPEKPGIRRLFDFLKSSNMPIALATSTSEKSARWMIERAGLSSYFTAFAFGSEVERGKPEPDIFLLARDRIGAATEVRRSDECAVFEDSPAGLRAAAAAGMKPVFVKDMVTPPAEVLALVWKEIRSLDQAASEAFFG